MLLLPKVLPNLLSIVPKRRRSITGICIHPLLWTAHACIMPIFVLYWCICRVHIIENFDINRWFHCRLAFFLSLLFHMYGLICEREDCERGSDDDVDYDRRNREELLESWKPNRGNLCITRKQLTCWVQMARIN